jgi:hypothetical protein
MKYYCRTTHNYNNETREWEYRDLEVWKTDHNILKAIDAAHRFTIGIHSFETEWEPLWRLVSNVYDYLLQECDDELYFKQNVTKEIIEKELISLAECYKKYDMIKER